MPTPACWAASGTGEDTSALEWRRPARSRRQLRLLNPREIRDFCLDPMEAEREVKKPFWRA
jgi:uncharacterized protein YjiS (DUF1127 family)